MNQRNDVPYRVPNHATGYRYTRHDHYQVWRMPDGSTEGTGWIEPGDTAVADRRIAAAEKRIAEYQAELETWKLLRAGLEAEAKTSQDTPENT